MRPFSILLAGLLFVVAVAAVFAPLIGVDLHGANPLPWALLVLIAAASLTLVIALLPCALVAIASLALLFAGPAVAADGTTIDLSGLAGGAVSVFGGVLLWLARNALNALVVYFRQKTQLDLDAHTRAYLDQALERAVTFGELQVHQLVDRTLSEIDLHDRAVAHAVNYVIDRVPDALAHFGITPPALTAMVEARMITLFDGDIYPTSGTEADYSDQLTPSTPAA
ncbi:hypothetical protein D3093_30070 (plasmid) [Azospirillum argentinense]|uniref:Uncharacterized protein n=1 Tax=Azospirillum argentinense TaxID=2970906 RepID=A0A4D8PMW3_9PROT|nr:hypothetical protein [Azospirillum argentinense]QCN98901.1 hypothetical protein D3093_26810 [Azospirillum argentinense]QCN99472.1 hypothetical protein D3093_30070 [Azospirillum argentinense]